MQTRIGSLVSTLLLIATSNAAEPAKFASGIVDIGMVAKDLEKTAKFYTEVVGLKEVKGFEASAEKATAFGLTDNQPAKVRMWDSSIELTLVFHRGIGENSGIDMRIL